MDKLGFSWSRQGIKYVISHKALFSYLKQFGHSADKYIPEDVFSSWPRSAQQLLFEYLYLGDGDKTGVNDLRYTTCSPRLRDGLVRLCTLLGYRANWVKSRSAETDNRGVKRDDLYRVSITERRVAISKNQSDRKVRRGYYTQNYSGKVYCCTVSTGIILVQRNGKCMWCGNSIIPDDQMSRDANGVPFEVLQSPLGLPSRLNTSQLAELQLGKIARKTGKTYSLPDFMPDESIIDYVDKEMKANGVEPDEDIYDPVTGKTIPSIQTGTMFFYKLKPHAPSAPSDKPIKLTVWFGFGIKQKSKWGQYKTTRPDTDNYIKTFKDVMTKCGFWLDDAQVVDERTIKTFTESPFIWVEVEEVDKIFGGIS